MKTSLDNIGAIFHPAVTVLNAGRIESTNGDFDYYTEGITPSVAMILEKIDQERVCVAEGLGFRAMSARRARSVGSRTPSGSTSRSNLAPARGARGGSYNHTRFRRPAPHRGGWGSTRGGTLGI